MWRKTPEGKPAHTGPAPVTPAGAGKSTVLASNTGTPAATAAAPAAPAVAATKPASAPAVAAPSNATSAVTATRAATGVPPGSTRLSKGLKFRGDFSGDSDLYIDSEFEGKINLGKSLVTIGPNGQVTCDIVAREIVIQGQIVGDLVASERICLDRTSKVRGDLLCARIQIEDGAAFQGGINMEQGKGQAKRHAAAANGAANEAKTEVAQKMETAN
jgi:cytoskeletal protein CcmA (bactofilin family)